MKNGAFLAYFCMDGASPLCYNTTLSHTLLGSKRTEVNYANYEV